MEHFTFHQLIDLLLEESTKTRSQLEKELALKFIQWDKLDSVPKDIIEKHFKISDADLDLLRKANIEVLEIFNQTKNK